MKCTHRAQAPTQDCSICPDCGSQPVPRKNRRLLLILAAIAAAVLALAAVVFIWIIRSPVVNISSAFGRSLEEGNLTFTLEVSDGSRLTGLVDIDRENRQCTLDATASFAGIGSVQLVIYDGYALYGYRGMWLGKTDISRQQEAFFDTLEQTANPKDLQALLENLGLLEKAREHLDLAQLKKSLPLYASKLASRRWLEKNAGYTSHRADGILWHRFAGDSQVFVDSSLEVFEPAFLENEDYVNLKQQLNSALSPLSGSCVSIGVCNGLLTQISLEQEDRWLQLTLSDIGTTQPDTQKLASILSSVK